MLIVRPRRDLDTRRYSITYDSWIVYVTWEVPAPNGEEWPLEVLDRYWQRTRDTVGDAGTAHCLFRTPDEMSEPGHQRGALLQPA